MKENHILPFLWMRGEPSDVIRNEIDKIHEAGINSVCLEARPHPDYAGNDWWKDVDLVIEEAKKRDMQIWILDDAHFPTGMANGGLAKKPEQCRRFLYTQFVDVTGPLPAVQVDVDLLMTKQFTWMDIGKEQEKPLLDETKLLSVTAYRVDHDDILTGEYIDLTKAVKDGYMTSDIPEGTWRIYVTFSSTSIGYKLDYINYIEKDSVQVLIDEVYEKHYEKYKDLFGTTIAGFFSDEPGFYNAPGYDTNNKLGRNMPLPWGKELDECIKAELADAYVKLPLLYHETKNKESRMVRVTYMDIVSRLYSKNFSCQLGDWCRNHAVQYIGHIVEDSNAHMRLVAGPGHYFRAMKGQDMAGIDNIGYQIMPCNDVASRHTGFQDLVPDFYHYELGKLGASDAAIDPAKKGRLMCENFGAYGWRLGVRDMKWLVDFLVGQGVNYFVPHAFSMAEYPDVDCPPHFYARGNNPQFEYFCKLMKYTDRLCNLFSDGKNIPQVSVLYAAEADWAGKTMMGYTVGKELLTHQIDFEFVSADVFKNREYFGCRVDDGQLIINERNMKALIVTECEYISKTAAEFIVENSSLKVMFINSYPIGIADAEDKELLKKLCDASEIVELEKLSEKLKAIGIYDEFGMVNSDPSILQYHYVKDKRDYLFLMNTSSYREIDAEISLKAGENYGIYDAMEDITLKLEHSGGKANVAIKPYESIVVCSGVEEAVEAEKQTEVKKVINIDTFDLGLKEIGEKNVKVINDFKLQPVSNQYRDFSGEMVYSKKILLEELPKKALFKAQYIFECMSVSVNGIDMGSKIVPPYDVDITKGLHEGENEIVIRVASTALRNANTKPGIFGKERTIIEPTGMFGEVKLELF